MFRKNKLRKKALAICVASVLWTVPSISTANGLKSEMDALFNEMSNVTQPGVFETQRRGVLAGGRYTTKTRIFNENLVSFTPPSWKAGCGGVDLFGGSLSFVNAEQIVTLLRSVAANAKGYAFQLALDNVFPDGAKWIENFQKKIQQLNQYLGNSCELAQGLMDGNGASELIKNKATQIRTTTSGLFDDVFSATQEQGGPSATGQERDNNFDEYKKHIGNIVWKQLKKNNVNGWFTYGDTVLLESIMSLTGTVTIGDAVPDSHPTINNETNPVHYLPGNKIQLTDLINGLVNKDIYSCGSDTESCLTAGVAGSGLKKISLPGIKKQIEGMLLGSSSGVGMVNKFASNTGELSDIEKNFLANLPVGTGTIVRNLSVLSRDSATIFVTESSGAISLAMMYSLANELFRSAFIAISNSNSPYKTQALETLSLSQENMRAEYSILNAQYGDLSSQIEKYNNLLNNVRKQKYMLSTLTKAPRTKE